MSIADARYHKFEAHFNGREELALEIISFQSNRPNIMLESSSTKPELNQSNRINNERTAQRAHCHNG